MQAALNGRILVSSHSQKRHKTANVTCVKFKAIQAWVNFFTEVVKITVYIVHVIRNSVVSSVSDTPQVFRKFF